MSDLKVSTAVTVHTLPIIDATGTPVTTLAAGTVDEIGVYKHEGIALVDISGTTTLTHRAGGIYTATLSTGDTGTVGPLMLFIRDDSECLPMARVFNVMMGHAYDGKYTSTLPTVDVAQWLTTAVTAGVGNRPAVDAEAISGSVQAADDVQANLPNLDAAVSGVPTAAANADAVWDEATAGHVAAGSFGLGVPLSAAERTALIQAFVQYDLSAETSLTDFAIGNHWRFGHTEFSISGTTLTVLVGGAASASAFTRTLTPDASAVPYTKITP